MSETPCAYIGIDTGRSLKLLASWKDRPGENPSSHPPVWPARASIETFIATTATSQENLGQAIRSMCAPSSGRPANCFLVCMGDTYADSACVLAEAMGLHGVIEPSQPCVLWSEGVLPSVCAKEYARSLPRHDARDLDILRACFAGLMEQAAEDLQTLQLDQDDSLLDRFVDARYAGRTETLTVPVASLTDPDRLLQPFHIAHAARYGNVGAIPLVEMVTARLRCILLPFYRPVATGDPPPGRPQTHPDWQRHDLAGGHTLWLPASQG